MGGRGRAQKSSSLSAEQMQALGVVGKDIPQVQTAPPPAFPAMLNKPHVQETTATQKYQLLWKEDFLDCMRDSPYYVVLTNREKPKPTYSDWRDRELKQIACQPQPDFNYKLLPRELNTTYRKRRALDQKPKLLVKKANIEDKLKILEQKELKTTDDVENDEIRIKQESDSDQEDEDDLADPEAALDDEMDEENDYGNSYFDNGEAYNEEDDNLDEGPVY